MDLGDPTRIEYLYMLLCGIFLGSLVITNVIAAKFFRIPIGFSINYFGDLTLGPDLSVSVGTIAYPLTFLATDLISEIWGKRRASMLVLTGFVTSVIVVVIILIARIAPIAENSYLKQDDFTKVFGLTPGIVFGSMIAYLLAQYCDIRVFHFWKRLTKGKYLWLRNNGSTMLSQLVDTVSVVTVTLVIYPMLDPNPLLTPIGFETWLNLVVGGYLFKAFIALVDTPVCYLGVWWIRKQLIQKDSAPDKSGVTESQT